MTIKREHKLEISDIHLGMYSRLENNTHCLYITGYEHTLYAVKAQEFGTLSRLSGDNGFKLDLAEGYPADAVAKELRDRYNALQ